ncbi:MAG: DUF547 domain-containing protein [Thermoleophilia bacterium]
MKSTDADAAPAGDGSDGDGSGENVVAGLLSSIRVLLEEFVIADGRGVDYERLPTSPEAKLFMEQTARLADFQPEILEGRAERLAFWLNLYNALVIQGVGRLTIGAPVSDSKDYFTREACRVGGRPYSLNDIEFGILKGNARRPWRPWRQFRSWDSRAGLGVMSPEPRLCFALVRGARSGPALRFWVARGIEGQLHEATTAFINSGGVVIDREVGILSLSRLFKWHAKDFGGGQGGMKFIAAHLEFPDEAGFVRSRAGRLKVAYLDFDRGLNRA